MSIIVNAHSNQYAMKTKSVFSSLRTAYGVLSVGRPQKQPLVRESGKAAGLQSVHSLMDHQKCSILRCGFYGFAAGREILMSFPDQTSYLTSGRTSILRKRISAPSD
jgi:hypothetical protein